MRQAAKRDRHSERVERHTRKSATCRKTFERTLNQSDLALLVREMRESALVWRPALVLLLRFATPRFAVL